MTKEDGLDRFVEAQDQIYARALGEIRRGHKSSHWMWFIFPQLTGLGRSAMAKLYGLGGADEAQAYLAHPLLGARYVECVEALQDLSASDPVAVFGEVDATKLRSSLTLFEAMSGRPLFAAALMRWFGGERDARTLAMLTDAGNMMPERLS
ncbi:DUF1810 domain-containing protein [Sphingopyxis sp. SCN 67-31]|jgi:uncharacterized protein (DUF1810 family)|uniref:DUF1810 domain-containing protein n=1 Tax=Sphingopyxis sp. SCN 67-31 TaxID=1660142 RepID=UPI00086B48F9|nr:DUF1810 domain-containing protein [Sphingopyxis sp. SCN 67-31]KAB2856415.1 MAG: DUF1810 domain-containing protein [Sphingopyxis terrae]MBN8843614.1 DUF1810 domain-containing protein [Sphingomonadales bacterium]ODU32340.1 MAG: calpastatin [Sphingopyxis sp. SCN 67-31]